LRRIFHKLLIADSSQRPSVLTAGGQAEKLREHPAPFSVETFLLKIAAYSPCIALATIALAIPVCAQNVTLDGFVRDPNQHPVVGAQVSLDGAAQHQVATTDDTGHYQLTALSAGTYRLTATDAGFQPVKTSVTLLPGGSLSRDLSFASVSATTNVTVTSSLSGSPAAGYYVGRVENGVLGTTPIVNQPFTITVLPATQIANTQVKSLRDAIKYLPLVSFNEQQGSEILRPYTRGIQGSIVQNTRMDGRAMAITGANAIEQYQALQVENGLGASFYGPANPSGMFNFVLKRPPAEGDPDQRFTNFYLDQDSSTIGTAYLDAGGRFGPNKIFGYRTNLLYGDGAAWVDNSRLRRRLAESAFDVRLTPKSLLEAHYSAYDIVQRGYPGWFTYGPNPTDKTDKPAHLLVLPIAPDPTRVGYGQPYAGVNLTTQSTGARYHYQVSPNWRLEAGALAQRLDRFIDTPVNNFTDNSGDYSASFATGFAPRFDTASDIGFLTGTVNKWGIRQDIVLGSEGYRFTQYSYPKPSAASVLLGTANIDAPRVYAPPATGLPKEQGLYRSSIVNQQGFNLGDMLTLPRGFLVRLAASQDWFGVDNNSASHARTGGSNKQGVSPSVSVLYKPAEWATAYATYAGSLQQGDIAPGNAVNANQALPPYRSKEWELGFKTSDHPIAITTDLFRIQRPFANTNAENVFAITGLQVNYGAEISAQGTLFHRLMLDGGFTALNARLNDTGIAATEGKRLVGTPPYKSNLYSEYRVPGISKFTLTGDWQFFGSRPQDDEGLNTTKGFNTFDLGFRYAHRIASKMATLRFTTANLGDAHYYSTIGPGDITGTNASANTAHLGAPRTIATSLQIAF
jgi:iron complex outermembrane receptor protein